MSGEESNKRQRISQACESCRKRKSRCDGSQPRCSICKLHNRICKYENSGRKRGLQVGYVRGIETFLGILVRDLPTSERQIRSFLRSSDNKFLDPSFVEQRLGIWHTSRLHEDLKKLLSKSEDKTAATVSDCLSPIAGDDEQEQHEPRPILVPATRSTPDRTFPEQLQSGDEQEVGRSTHTAPSLPANALELVDLYLKQIHCWFPIVERRDILYILHSDNSPECVSIRDKGRRACLLSIIALTSASQKLDHDHAQLAHSTTAGNTGALADDGDFDIGHIQAALLQTLLKIGYQQLDAARINLGQVTGMIQVYTVTALRPDPRLPHCLHGCRILDVLVSAIVRRLPCHMLPVASDTLLEEDALDEWEGWECSVAGRTKRLPLRSLSIFNFITQLLDRLQICVSAPQTQLYAVADLSRWFTSLPAYCSLSESEFATPSVLHLHLFYCFTILFAAQHTVIQDSSIVTETSNKATTIIRRLIDTTGYTSPVLGVLVRLIAKCLTAMYPRCDQTEAVSIAETLQTLRADIDVNWRTLQTRATAEPSPSTHPSGLPRVNLNDQFALNSHLNSTGNPSIPNFHLSNVFEDKQFNTSHSPTAMIDGMADFVSCGRSRPSTNPSGHTDTENDFDALLQDLPFDLDCDGCSPETEFAQNLGFFTGDLDPSFLAMINP